MKTLLMALAMIGMTATAAEAQDCHCNVKHDMRQKHASLKSYKYTRMAGYVSKDDCMAFEQAGRTNMNNDDNTAYIHRNEVNAYMGYTLLPKATKTAPESPNTDVVKGQAPQTPNADNQYQ